MADEPEGSLHGQGTQFLPFKTSQSALEPILLHGTLDIWVKEAKKLPNMDQLHTMTSFLGGLSIKRKSRGTSDPYVTISVANAILARTFVMKDNENPSWMQHFHVNVAHTASEVHFVVKDDDVVGSEIIGAVGIPTQELNLGQKIEGKFPILKSNGKNWETGASLSLSIKYVPIDKTALYQSGVGSGPDYGVPRTYFPLRKGNRVTLYQDAHCEDGMLPDIKLDDGKDYVHGKCWHDIFNAISNARRLTYITGWSVTHLVRLVRNNDSEFSSVTLGDLLKDKAQQGVRVLLLVWDDPTSRRFFQHTTEGMLGTDDEVTYKFFKGSAVQVVLCPRSGGKGHSLLKKQEAGAIYTHHQKTVILDADAGNGNRKIIAFVGGLDLCKGRYDTPEHPLFRTLETDHNDDYHNPNFVGSSNGCPREPWHDLHSKIDGPAAYDILANFQERWLKASRRGLKKLKGNLDDHLLKIERIPDIVGDDDAVDFTDDDVEESWDVQVFRSIDSNSVKGFPKNPRDATKWNLSCGKNVLIDMSIQAAYVHSIRSAQHFIYIENQYFLGSSFNWDSYRSLGANNLIPVEIALKIASKIRKHERFAAYIVVPMWPEGDPKSMAMQRILFWQYKTMQMMYQIIFKALEETGMEHTYEPQDYLNFFCLGNREVLDEISNTDSSSGSSGSSPQSLLRKNRRFMIYVHSKGMIVDDEFVILGSANINQRSMEGTRDTEIAMGAYQPHHTWAQKNSGPRGQIYGYRMSLWAEHLGTTSSYFMQPESVDCVRQVRFLGEQNWRQFAADVVTEMKGHLLKYPVNVDKKGRVGPLLGSEKFPDLGGKVIGTFSGITENLTI